MTRIADLGLPCPDCIDARDAAWTSPRTAEVAWHAGLPDERYVCKRCYARLYAREKRG